MIIFINVKKKNVQRKLPTVNSPSCSTTPMDEREEKKMGKKVAVGASIKNEPVKRIIM